MTPTDERVRYQPSPIGEASVRNDDGRLTLVFVKDLAHAPESVWAALTDPDELREWAPFDAPRSLAVLGPVTLLMAGGNGTEHSPAVVTRSEPPRLLEYSWEKDFLRWELVPTAAGTRLTLSHTVSGPEWLPKVAAGWHICLDVADRWLHGEPVGRIAAEDAMRFGWGALNESYTARFARVLPQAE